MEPQTSLSSVQAAWPEPASQNQASSARQVPAALGRPVAPDQGWSMDFSSDRLTKGRRFRTLSLIDEINRGAWAIEVDTSLPLSRVIRVLEQVETWGREYNEERPKKALGGLTPAAYAKQLR